MTWRGVDLYGRPPSPSRILVAKCRCKPSAALATGVGTRLIASRGWGGQRQQVEHPIRHQYPQGWRIIWQTCKNSSGMIKRVERGYHPLQPSLYIAWVDYLEV